ncbi:MAG: hypothetical protein ABIH66_01530 [bacterium]
MNKDANATSKLFIFLLIDASAYFGAIFFVQLYNLLHFDGAAKSWQYVLVTAVCSTIIFILALAHQKIHGRFKAIPAAAEVVFFLLIALGPLILIERLPAEKGFSLFWMPGEWLKLPRAIMLGVRVTFPFFILYAAALLAGLYAMLRGGKPVLIYGALVVTWIFAVSCALTLLMQVDVRSSLLVIGMLFPMLLTLAGTMLKAGRFTARSITALLFSMAILPFYFGLVPYFSNNPALGKIICRMTPGCGMSFSGDAASPAPGMVRLYPRAGQNSKFPLAFLREFYFDRRRDFLFSTYGPTCGFVRLDMSTGNLEVKKYGFLVRYLWSEDDLPYLLAPDWYNSDMLVLDKDSFEIKKRFDLYNIGINVSWNIAADNKYIYLLSTELPLLARFERGSFKFVDKLDFKQLGLIPMSFGAYGLVLDPTRDHAFINLGAYDLKYTFRLVRVDTNSFKLEATRYIRTGSTLMTILPSKGTLLMYDFYAQKVTEIDQETLETRRTFDGVVQCRAAALDEARDLLYMVGFGLGELKAIDYSSGKTLSNYHIGNKAGSMFLLPEEDVLLVGSDSGIYRVDLNKFTGISKKTLPEAETR